MHFRTKIVASLAIATLLITSGCDPIDKSKPDQSRTLEAGPIPPRPAGIPAGSSVVIWNINLMEIIDKAPSGEIVSRQIPGVVAFQIDAENIITKDRGFKSIDLGPYPRVNNAQPTPYYHMIWHHPSQIIRTTLLASIPDRPDKEKLWLDCFIMADEPRTQLMEQVNQSPIGSKTCDLEHVT